MKKLFLLLFTIACFSTTSHLFAQSKGGGDYKGPGNLNIGLTSGFSDYGLGVQADYEFNLARDFTVGPSVGLQTWDNAGKNGTSIGVGARFRWYADRVFNLTHPKWDVFANGDIGFNINSFNNLWWGIGIGGKFHISEGFGLQAIIGSGAQIGVHFQL